MYNMGKRDLPNIYAQAQRLQARGRWHIYQANPKCTCYKCYIPLPALFKNLPKLTGNCSDDIYIVTDVEFDGGMLL